MNIDIHRSNDNTLEMSFPLEWLELHKCVPYKGKTGPLLVATVVIPVEKGIIIDVRHNTFDFVGGEVGIGLEFWKDGLMQLAPILGVGASDLWKLVYDNKISVIEGLIQDSQVDRITVSCHAYKASRSGEHHWAVDEVSAYKHSRISYETLREVIAVALHGGTRRGLVRTDNKFYYATDHFEVDNVPFVPGIEIRADTHLQTGLLDVRVVLHTPHYIMEIICARYRPIPLRAHDWRFRLQNTIRAAVEYSKKMPALYQKKGIKPISIKEIKLDLFAEKWELIWDDGLPIPEIRKILEGEFKERQNLLAAAIALGKSAELKKYYDTPSMRDKIRQYSHQVILHG